MHDNAAYSYRPALGQFEKRREIRQTPVYTTCGLLSHSVCTRNGLLKQLQAKAAQLHLTLYEIQLTQSFPGCLC